VCCSVLRCIAVRRPLSGLVLIIVVVVLELQYVAVYHLSRRVQIIVVVVLTETSVLQCIAVQGHLSGLLLIIVVVVLTEAIHGASRVLIRLLPRKQPLGVLGLGACQLTGLGSDSRQSLK